MAFLIWKNSDVKIFLGIMITLVISVLMLLPPDQWSVLIGYFMENPPLLIFGQLGILLICTSILFVLVTFIWRILK